MGEPALTKRPDFHPIFKRFASLKGHNSCLFYWQIQVRRIGNSSVGLQADEIAAQILACINNPELETGSCCVFDTCLCIAILVAEQCSCRLSALLCRHYPTAAPLDSGLWKDQTCLQQANVCQLALIPPAPSSLLWQGLLSSLPWCWTSSEALGSRGESRSRKEKARLHGSQPEPPS